MNPDQILDWEGEEFIVDFVLGQEGEYIVNRMRTPKKNIRYNLIVKNMKGGVGHLIPSTQPAKDKSSGPERKVSPSN